MESAAQLSGPPPDGRHAMRYIRIALYDLKPGNYADVVSKANAGLLPLFQASPGFQSFGVSEVDKGSFVSVSTWQTREQADTATAKAAEWAKANSSEQFTLRHNYIGDLAIDADAREFAASVR
jgi:heme-degrading monooxygenase HmoA